MLSNDIKFIGLLRVLGEQWTHEVTFLFVCIICIYSEKVDPQVWDKWYVCVPVYFYCCRSISERRTSKLPL